MKDLFIYTHGNRYDKASVLNVDSFDEIFFTDRLIHNCLLSGNEKTIVASPSKKDPDYYFEWVRDSAITVMMIIDLLNNPMSLDPKTVKYSDVKEILQNYVSNHRYFQDVCITEPICTCRSSCDEPIILSLGEPKMLTSCEPFNDRWGRPQNDGPALRAIAMISYALFLLRSYGSNPTCSKINYIKKNLYDSKWPISHTIIKRDLEYICAVYADNCFDLWEELTGLHFYTLMVQKHALNMGSHLAYSLGDYGAHVHYCSVIKKIDKLIKRFYVDNHHHTSDVVGHKHIISSITSSAESYTCLRNIDASIILAYLHTDTPVDSALINTCAELILQFNPDMRFGEHNTVLIGRYPNDKYYDGNPWVLTTAAVACVFAAIGKGHYVLDDSMMLSMSDKVFKILNMKFSMNIDKFKHRCTMFAKNILKALMEIELHNIHLNETSSEAYVSFAEQINKNTHRYVSAKELTWNYVEILRLIRTLTKD